MGQSYRPPTRAATGRIGFANADQEFTSARSGRSFAGEFIEEAITSSQGSQMLSTLAEVGLVYKNRHGKYSLAVPLLGQFIQRQTSNDLMLKALESKEAARGLGMHL